MEKKGKCCPLVFYSVTNLRNTYLMDNATVFKILIFNLVVPNSHLALHPHEMLSTGSPNDFKRSSVRVGRQMRTWLKRAGTGL